jgi:hypothetical protein
MISRKAYLFNQTERSFMSEVEIFDDSEAISDAATMEKIYVGNCPSLTNRSILTYEIARDPEDQSLHLAIVGNSGAGMFCRDFSSAKLIDSIVTGSEELTSTAFQVCHPHRSSNTAGFILAVLADLGLVRRGKINTRLHEHVEGTAFDQVVLARLEASKEAVKSKRKSKEG